MATTLEHEPQRSRYVIKLDDVVVGEIDYAETPDRIVFTHTEVRPELRRRGLAGELVEFALRDVRSRTSAQVVPQCPYVSRWMAQHPDFAELASR